MKNPDDLAILRARDFWAALALLFLSLFFLWRTSLIPLFGGNRAGVNGADWYNSAAVVPLGIFAALFVLSVVLLGIALKAGAGEHAFSLLGLGWNKAEALRFTTIGIVLFFYVSGLVPRVDFIISSGLLITALVFGYYGGHANRMITVAIAVSIAGIYALARHLPQSEWGAWDDDWVALTIWGLLTLLVLAKAKGDRVLRAAPIIAIAAPTILVCAMAFGFRQNVPNRGGLIFKQIEYHYYVTLRPLWRD